MKGKDRGREPDRKEWPVKSLPYCLRANDHYLFITSITYLGYVYLTITEEYTAVKNMART